MSTTSFRRMDDGGGEARGWPYVLVAILATLALVLAIFGLAVFIQFQINDPKNIKHINGVGPNHGNVGLVEGIGMDIVDSPAGSTITINTLAVLDVTACNAGISIGGTSQHPTVCNEGVLNVTSGNAGISIGGTSQDPTIANEGVLNVTAGNAGISIGGTSQDPTIVNEGVLNVTAGDAITITGTAQNPIINNNGVKSLTASTGIYVTPGPTGDLEVGHSISQQTIVLPAGDANGTVVRYLGVAQDIVTDDWTIVPLVVFPGDAGQGDVNGTAWMVPAHGFYTASITCSITVTLPAAEDRVGASIVLVLAPVNVANPDTGILLPGGHVRTDISVGANGIATNAPTVAPTGPPTTAPPTASPTTASPTTASPPTTAAAPTASPTAAPTTAPLPIDPTVTFVSATASFQSCPSGHIAIGDQLYVYARLDRRGISADALSMDVACSIQTARLV